MPHAEARIQTPHPSRYLVQLCQHAQKFSHKLRHLHDHHLHDHKGRDRPDILEVIWTDSDGTLRLSWGTCTLHAEGTTLTVRADATDEDNLERVQDIITADLERFGRRDHLTVTWTRVVRD